MTAETNNLFIINLENLVETLGDTLRPDTSVEMTFIQSFNYLFLKLVESLSGFV